LDSADAVAPYPGRGPTPETAVQAGEISDHQQRWGYAESPWKGSYLLVNADFLDRLSKDY